jgi:hypothetical protein
MKTKEFVKWFLGLALVFLLAACSPGLVMESATSQPKAPLPNTQKAGNSSPTLPAKQAPVDDSVPLPVEGSGPKTDGAQEMPPAIDDQVGGDEAVDIKGTVLKLNYQNTQGCTSAVYDSGRVLVGDCGKTSKQGKVSALVSAKLAEFVQTFRSFEAQTKAGSIKFTGTGPKDASDVDKENIADWARQTTQQIIEQGELVMVNTGLIIEWHRSGGIAGVCDKLSVYADGRMEATSCKGDKVGSAIQGQMTAEQMLMLSTWVEKYQSFQSKQGNPAIADGFQTEMMFNGTGQTPADTNTQKAIMQLSAQLLTQLRRP